MFVICIIIIIIIFTLFLKKMVLQSHMNNTLFTPQKKFIQQIFSTKENVLNTENGTWNIILKL